MRLDERGKQCPLPVIDTKKPWRPVLREKWWK